MKKFQFFAVLIPLLLAGCAQEENLSAPNDSPKETISNASISLDEARTLAVLSAKTLRGQSSRSSLTVERVTPFVLPASRSGVIDTLFYAVDFADNQGYAMISKRRIKDPVLAVIDEGTFNVADIYENSPFGQYVQNIMMQQVIAPIDTLPEPYDFIIYNTDTTAISNTPKAPHFWGQKYPFGYLCPNKMCGCVALACILTMSHWEQPQSIHLTYDGSGEYLPIDWEAIKKHGPTSALLINECASECSSSDILHHSMARLGLEMATSLYSVFQNNSTSAPVSSIIPVMTSHGYQCVNYGLYTTGLTINMENKIIIAIGNYSSMGQSGGHAFIIDGSKGTKYEQTAYIRRGDSFILEPLPEENRTWHTIYNHINWGWGGYNNGYFSETNWQVNKGELDDGTFNLEFGTVSNIECIIVHR